MVASKCSMSVVIVGVTKLCGRGMVPFRGIFPTTVLCTGFRLFKGGFIKDKAEPEDLRLDNCSVGPPFDF